MDRCVSRRQAGHHLCTATSQAQTNCWATCRDVCRLALPAIKKQQQPTCSSRMTGRASCVLPLQHNMSPLAPAMSCCLLQCQGMQAAGTDTCRRCGHLTTKARSACKSALQSSNNSSSQVGFLGCAGLTLKLSALCRSEQR